jgi:hypothetical protein
MDLSRTALKTALACKSADVAALHGCWTSADLIVSSLGLGTTTVLPCTRTARTHCLHPSTLLVCSSTRESAPSSTFAKVR